MGREQARSVSSRHGLLRTCKEPTLLVGEGWRSNLTHHRHRADRKASAPSSIPAGFSFSCDMSALGQKRTLRPETVMSRSLFVMMFDCFDSRMGTRTKTRHTYTPCTCPYNRNDPGESKIMAGHNYGIGWRLQSEYRK